MIDDPLVEIKAKLARPAIAEILPYNVSYLLVLILSVAILSKVVNEVESTVSGLYEAFKISIAWASPIAGTIVYFVDNYTIAQLVRPTYLSKSAFTY